MDQTAKDQLRAKTTAHISEMSRVLNTQLDHLDQTLAAGTGTFVLSESDTAFEDELRAKAAQGNTTMIREQLAELAQSPYFARLDLDFSDEPERPYYIAKYSASELGIYSWTAPIASLRFEQPGSVTYRTPLAGDRQGTLSRRDQYMIARGHLNFMTTEALNAPRELVYQEHFSARKTGFVLPEVVAQMEKAQDQVIRANYQGAFAIAGPAGSGKTTLALHRVAYLRQSPETAHLFPAETILVLVQDAGTEDYFSHLLPELGIHDVQITTFGRWAIAQLGLGQFFYHARPGRTEHERNEYEFAKVSAIRNSLPGATSRDLKQPVGLLLAHYAQYLSPPHMALLKEELAEGALDRYDLTLLLQLTCELDERLLTTKDQLELVGRKTRKTTKTVPLEYSLILVDEFQNYLPEQLTLLRSTIGATKAMLYIGDAAQRTQFGAISSLADAHEVLPSDRSIRLQKVYRNTRQILEYIASLGYAVEIPEGIASGAPVYQYTSHGVLETLQYLVGLTRPPGTSLGIIVQNPDELDSYADYFADDASVHCLTMREAQGVEFEMVCFIMATVSPTGGNPDSAFTAETARIERDLMYVALTRAMAELHVIGTALGA